VAFKKLSTIKQRHPFDHSWIDVIMRHDFAFAENFAGFALKSLMQSLQQKWYVVPSYEYVTDFVAGSPLTGQLPYFEFLTWAPLACGHAASLWPVHSDAVFAPWPVHSAAVFAFLHSAFIAVPAAQQP
jgi:hypothetical protein